MSQSNPVVKLFECHYQKELYGTVLANDVVVPIHVGRAVASHDNISALSHMLGDDTGDNISLKNQSFCELTGLYWIWKHISDLGSPDSVGFMHYRRWLFFKDLTKVKTKINPNLSKIKKKIVKYDLIVPKYWSLQRYGFDLYTHYRDQHHIKDLDLAFNTTLEKYPEYKSAIECFYQERGGYFFNVFIMKKELFIKYCEFLFSVMFACEKHIDHTRYDAYNKRVMGFLGERLFNLFVIKLKLDGNIEGNQISIYETKLTELHKLYKI